MRRLVDGDPASNNGGWQWAASTGADAQPYFRIFNPTTQGERFDPAGSTSALGPGAGGACGKGGPPAVDRPAGIARLPGPHRRSFARARGRAGAVSRGARRWRMTARGAGRPRPEAGDGGEGGDDASDVGRPRPAVGPVQPAARSAPAPWRRRAAPMPVVVAMRRERSKTGGVAPMPRRRCRW